MKVIILAAGEGSRLRPLTKDKPKCMVEYKGKPIIDYILETIDRCNLKDISIVGGYKFEILKKHLGNKELIYYKNTEYHSSNMVYSLFSAKEFMDDDLIISYSDIVYEESVLKKLIGATSDLNIVIDKEWKELWDQRMENPLDDAETLKLTDNKISEIGKKPNSFNDIEGQYIGLIKISKNIIKDVVSFYESLPTDKLYDNKDFNNMYMTSFLQLLIDNSYDAVPTFIDGGWIEVDCISDLNTNFVNKQ